MHFGLHVKCPLFVSDFNETKISRQIFGKNAQITNFIKIRLAEADLFNAGEGTNMTKFTCERALKTGELSIGSVTDAGSVLNTTINR